MNNVLNRIYQRLPQVGGNTVVASNIKKPKGDAVFEMHGVEVPVSWSQVATDILAQKYYRRTGVPQTDGSTGSENSIKQVVHRLAECWMVWGKKYGYFASDTDAQIFYDEVVYMIMGQYAAPNSPQWFNTGLHTAYGISVKGNGHWYVDPETILSLIMGVFLCVFRCLRK